MVVNGPYIIDENYKGANRKDATALVVDSTISRNPSTLNKTKISYILTVNPEFWAGQNTVAIFKIKKAPAATGTV